MLEKREAMTKKRRLQLADLLMKDPKLEEKSSKRSWTQQLQEKVLNNLQVVVSNVHIRYEEETLSGFFSAGITVDSAKFESADSDWKPCFLKQIVTSVVRKLAQLKDLSVYLDCNKSKLKYDPNSISSFKNAMLTQVPLFLNFPTIFLLKSASKKIPKSNNDAGPNERESKHNFILEPVGGELKLTINQQENLPEESPRIFLDFNFPKLKVAVNEHQYKEALNSVDTFYYEMKNYKVNHFSYSNSFSSISLFISIVQKVQAHSGRREEEL